MDQIELEQAFERARAILASSGHKIFTGNTRVYRKGLSLVALRPKAYKQSLSGFVVRIFQNRLVVGFLQPDCYDAAVQEEFREIFGKILKERHRLFSHIRQENWWDMTNLIAPEERAEFAQVTMPI